MKSIYSCMSTLTEAQQINVKDELLKILPELGLHLAAAIRFANRQAGVSDADFWAGMFDPTDVVKQISIYKNGENGHYKTTTPRDPYDTMDLQACQKYLFFGGNRQTTQDQKNFFNLFLGPENTAYSYIKRGTSSILQAGTFSDLLKVGIDIRNYWAGHSDKAKIDKLTLADRVDFSSIPYVLRVISGLLEPLRTVNWDAVKRQACIDFTNGLWGRIYHAIGDVPYSIPGIMKAMGIPEADRANVEHDFIEANLRIQADQVFVCGDIADVAYALYFSWSAVHNKEAEMFQSLYNSVRLRTVTAPVEEEPDWDALTVAELRILADKGKPEAQYRLGLCYLKGEGIVADEGQAYQLFQKAANQGHPRAQVQMGKFCELGKGGQDNPYRDDLFGPECLIDLEEAANWYLKAAGQNDAEGCFHLGRCYEQGIGLPRDMIRARRCYSRAANDGCHEAKVALDMLYLRSLGCQNSDKSVAQAMLEKLTETVPAAKTALGICYQHGHGIMPDIRQAVTLYREAAELGDAQAKYQLAKCYEQGFGVELDRVTYFALLQEAADMGCPEAAIEGQFDPPTWQEKDQGNAQAQCLLAECLPEEWSGEEILRLYSTAAKKGYQPAVYGMAKCYDQGIGVRPDYGHAVHLCKQAANAGEVNAMVRLAQHYHDVACGKVQDGEYEYEGGEGYAMAHAKSWYQFAARCGHPDAQKWLIANTTSKEAEKWRNYAAQCGNA